MDQPLPMCVFKPGEICFTNFRVSIKLSAPVLKIWIGLLSWDHQRQVEYLIPELCYQCFKRLYDAADIGIRLCMALKRITYTVVEIFLWSGA